MKINFDMEDRLLKLLDTEQLSSAKFADAIGVQRSSVSHILSGRNKPSFDFLQKTLKAFPMVNADWLILGEGNMYEGDVNPVSGSLFDHVPVENGHEPSLITNQTEESEDNGPNLGTPDDDISSGIDPEPEKSYPGDVKVEADNRIHGAGSVGGVDSDSKSHIGKERTVESGEKNSKPISRVIVFYTDKTFESYEKGD